MPREINVLIKLNLCNLYGLNVFKNNKDKKAKRTYMLLATVMLLTIAVLAVYIGLLVYGYVQIGLAEVIPSYLIMISSLIVLFFGIFKAGPVIFERKGYDMLCSLPCSNKAIVISRFIRMYVENIAFLLVVMLPGILVYGVLMKPAISFYLLGFIVTILLPFAPMTISVILGTLFAAISSRTKYKSVIGAILPIVVIIGLLVLVGQFSLTEGQITLEMLVDFAELITSIISSIYPPAIWLGNMMLGNGISNGILFAIGAFVALSVTVYLIGNNFNTICQQLYSTAAKHEFTMGQQKQRNLIVSLCKKELQRYFASSVYLSNTIVGPILAVVMARTLLFVDLEEAFRSFPIEIDVVGIVPLAIGTTFCMMNTTSTSISMEGKEWWLIKTLPLTTKEILDGKLIMNVLVFAPFYIASVVLMWVVLRPVGLDLLWTIASPAVLIVFSCVWGITANLKFPSFSWENETTVVKQSASALVGGLCSALFGIAGIILLILVPREYRYICKVTMAIALMGVTIALYFKNNKVNLEKL